MERVNTVSTSKFSRAEWIFLAIMMVVLAHILAGNWASPKRHGVHYKHSLAYPKFQDKTLLRIGSLDRG